MVFVEEKNENVTHEQSNHVWKKKRRNKKMKKEPQND